MVSMYQGKEIDSMEKWEEVIQKTSISTKEASDSFRFILYPSDDSIRFNEIDTGYNIEPVWEPVWEPIYQSQKRLKCAYCDCINNKDFGICDYCGAPLKE